MDIKSFDQELLIYAVDAYSDKFEKMALNHEAIEDIASYTEQVSESITVLILIAEKHGMNREEALGIIPDELRGFLRL